MSINKNGNFMFKKVITISLLLFIASCGSIMNSNKPELRDNKAIISAYANNVVDEKDRYFWGNMLLLLLFPIGTVIGAIGLFTDQSDNNYYVVTDPEGYEAWKAKYLESIKKQREQLLNHSN